MRAKSSATEGQIRSIQVLRAVAALAVVVFHATVLWRDRAAPVLVSPWENGNSGVDLFFVISGFIMVVSSGGLACRADGWRRFLEYRLIRIAPLYWFASSLKLISFVVFPSLALHMSPTPWNAIASFLFIPSRNGLGVVEPVVVVGWTLSFEMLFYLAFALALACFVRPAILVTCLLAPLTLLALIPMSNAPAIATLTNPILLEFIFGMLIAELYLAQQLRVLPSLLASLLLLGGLATLALVPAAGPWQRVEIWGVAAAAAVFGAVVLEPSLKTRLPRSWVAIGEASYALYLFQGFALPPLGIIAERAHLSGLTMGLFLILTSIGLTIALALAIHRFVERPTTLWLRHRIGAGRPAEMAPAPTLK